MCTGYYDHILIDRVIVLRIFLVIVLGILVFICQNMRKCFLSALIPNSV